MEIEQFRRFAELKRLIADHEREVKALKAEASELEAELVGQLGDEGVASLKVNNGKRKVNLSLNRQLWATNLESPEATAAACKAAGLGELVSERANTQTLSAYLRDLERAGESMPREFEGVVGTFEKFSISVTAS